MAVVAPMADEYRQLAGKSTTPLVHDIVCVHTMVGTLEGSISWSARAGGSYWHFGLGGKGKLVQCQDLRFRSAANLQGNWHVIPIETADIKEGVFPDTWQDPPWTNAQIDKLVSLIAWLCVRYNIPPVLIPDTKPGRRGLAYHRQGINPWRVDGGELWSNSNGKICPASRVTQFINVVIPRVQQILNPPPLEDDMTPAECEAVLKKVIATPGHPFRLELAAIVDSRLDRKAGKDWLVALDVNGPWWRTDGRTRTLVSGRPYAEWLIGSGFVYADGLLPHVVSQEMFDRLEEEPVLAPPS